MPDPTHLLKALKSPRAAEREFDVESVNVQMSEAPGSTRSSSQEEEH